MSKGFSLFFFVALLLLSLGMISVLFGGEYLGLTFYLEKLSNINIAWTDFFSEIVDALAHFTPIYNQDESFWGTLSNFGLGVYELIKLPVEAVIMLGNFLYEVFDFLIALVGLKAIF